MIVEKELRIVRNFFLINNVAFTILKKDTFKVSFRTKRLEVGSGQTHTFFLNNKMG
tara:strand:+ start:1157 stop:1324 length:168 start_codon:yes stop_codon:yes gene_type:complete